MRVTSKHFHSSRQNSVTCLTNQTNQETNRKPPSPNKFSSESHRNFFFFFFFNHSLFSKCSRDLQPQTREVHPTSTEPSTSAQNSSKTQNGEGTPMMIRSTSFLFITYGPPSEGGKFRGHVHHRQTS